MFKLKLKELRENAGLSQARFGEELGVRQSTVGMWESGKNKPEYDTLLKIAKYFDVSVDTLIADDSTSPTKDTTDESEELNELLQEAKDRPEIHALFSLAKGASKEDVEKTIDIIKVLRKSNDPTDY